MLLLESLNLVYWVFCHLFYKKIELLIMLLIVFVTTVSPLNIFRLKSRDVFGFN